MARRCLCSFCFFFSSRRRHTRLQGDWSSDVCSSDLIAEVIKRPLTLVHVEPGRGGTPVPFGQNLVYDCHAVYTTTRIRSELGIRPRYTLAAGLAQTFEWDLREGLDRRDVDFSAEDA